MEQRPKTIEELKQWYIDRNLPTENITRFFIGKDYKGAKAFGIFKDEITGKYVVYKNKTDGTRSIRYAGVDEAYAVNELYQKLKYEIYNQKNNNPKNFINHTISNINNTSNSVRNKNNYSTLGIHYNNHARTNYTRKNIKLSTLIVIFVIIYILITLIFTFSPKRGYYNYNNTYYYYQNGSWYKYNKYESWTHTTVPQPLKDKHSDYYSSYNYMYSYGIDDFKDSIYYAPLLLLVVRV